MAAQEAGKRVILLGVDASPQAEHAFKWFSERLHREGDKVVLLHVPEGPTIHGSKGMRLPDGELAKMAEKEKAETQTLSDKYKKLSDECQISSELRIMYGKAGEAIVAAAQELNAVFIVMGTRGMGRLRRTIMGSVSDYVVHHAHCPVLVCRQ